MPLLLPNLDDRTWSELVDESRALIPVYGPEWTDHNASDPGITLIELLAWIAEMQIYDLNQISDRQRLKFLKLVGVVPRPPQPAKAIVSITPDAGQVTLPGGVEFSDITTIQTHFRTRQPLTVTAGELAALQVSTSGGFKDLTPGWRRHGVLNPLGDAPVPAAEFYIGLTSPLPVGTSVQFYFTFVGGPSGDHERFRILREGEARREDCRETGNPCTKQSRATACKETVPDNTRSKQTLLPPLQHHGARTVWEFMSASGGNTTWLPLDEAKGEVRDNTRSFTLDGSVVFCVPQQMEKSQVGAVSGSFYYLRCRLAAGSYDAAPILRSLAFNGVEVEQAVPSGMPFLIDPAATIEYGTDGPPSPGDLTRIEVSLDARKNIVELKFGIESGPQFLVYDYHAPSGASAGLLAIEGIFLGFGTGLPNQKVCVSDAPLQQDLQLYTLENKKWLQWKLRMDFDASTRKDFHAVLDATTGRVTFGNGEKGRVPPLLRDNSSQARDHCLIFATYEATHAEAGNVSPDAITKLADSAHNKAILAGLASPKLTIHNPLAAWGGAAAETVPHASGRADRVIETSERAVTLADYERLAKQTPGTLIARVSARANRHPSFPCFKAPGMITVIVLPHLPAGRPMPSRGLLNAVELYLRRRRLVGTRVEVVAPRYLDVSVQADVRAHARTDKAALQTAIVRALNKFLDPLMGGPDGTGWPFGRAVYRSEIMRVIDEVPGADYVSTLALLGEDGVPQCGNICLGPTWLVAAGKHQITIL